MDTVKEAYQRNHIPLSHVGIKKYGELPYTDTKLLENIQMDRHEKPVVCCCKKIYFVLGLGR